MEIERRFIVAGFPNAKIIRKASIEQGYLCIDEVEARIRKTVKEDCITYKLCFKSDGTLSRKEVEFEIDEVRYLALLDLLTGTMIKKDYRVYEFMDKHLEVCEVDADTETAYYYAEIEFDTEEEAMAFNAQDIPLLIKEVTYDSSYNMKNYWLKTRRK